MTTQMEDNVSGRVSGRGSEAPSSPSTTLSISVYSLAQKLSRSCPFGCFLRLYYINMID